MAVMHLPILLQPIVECMCKGPLCRCGAKEAGDEVKPEELSAFPRILAVDPGSTTGWCVLWFDPDMLFDRSVKTFRAHVAWWAGNLLGPELSQVDWIMDRIRMDGVGGEGLCVVGEHFVVQNVFTDASFLSPVRVLAALGWALHRGQRECDGIWRHRSMPPPQTPADAKSITDAQLQLWNMYLPGKDHARDATRHAVLWMRRLRMRGEDFYDTWHFVDDAE